MTEKIADNRIYSSKERINIIDNEIDQNKKILKQFDNFQENTKSLQKSLNRCIELLEQSVKGEKVNRMYEDMKNKNALSCNKTLRMVDEKILSYQKEISSLNDQKDNIISEMRKENKKEEDIDKKEIDTNKKEEKDKE